MTMMPQTIFSIKYLHVSLLQTLDSVEVPLQLFPLCLAGLWLRVLAWIPPLQLALHGLQFFQGSQLQSTVINNVLLYEVIYRNKQKLSFYFIKSQIEA